MRKLTSILQHVAVFPVPDTVLFPGVVLSLGIFEAPYRRMVADALASHGCVVVAMIEPGTQSRQKPMPSEIGCVGQIIHSEPVQADRYNILIQGLERVRLVEEIENSGLYRRFRAETVPRPSAQDLQDAHKEWVRLQSCICSLKEVAAATDQELVDVLSSTADPLELTDILAAVLVRKPAQQQQLLATSCLKTRLNGLIDSMMDVMARYTSQPESSLASLN